jgi:hypothetical protein
MANGSENKNQEAAEIAAPQKAKPSTHFEFSHKLFEVPGAYFYKPNAQDAILLAIPLGEMQATMPIDAIRLQFAIKSGTKDGDLLDMVEKSLKFVKRIAPGDSIPAEILDGTASWRVEARHLSRANARISVSILAWITGRDVPAGDSVDFEAIAERPENKEQIVAAFDVVAEKIGIGKANKSQVLNRISSIAKEFAYIEALRERFVQIRKVVQSLRVLQPQYENDRRVSQDIGRIVFLISAPVKSFDRIFLDLDGQLADANVALRRLTETVAAIRKGRDDLHHRFMIWDELIAAWKDVELKKGRKIEQLLQATYRFVARYFPQDQQWSLSR